MAQLPFDVPSAGPGADPRVSLGRLRLDRPFTPSMARAAGVSRADLGREIEAGRVRPVLRGVYAVAGPTESAEFRARAVALLARGAVAVGRTAAWIHGADLPRPAGHLLPPLELLPRRGLCPGHPPYRPHEVGQVAAQPVTSPVRTIVDLAGRVRPEIVTGVADALLRNGRLRHADLVTAAGVPAPGARRLRRLVGVADGRAADFAESVLRMWWLRTDLPTPVLGTVASGVRLPLALPSTRFGAMIASGPEPPAHAARLRLGGWHVVEVAEQALMHGDSDLVQHHLVREFRGHLARIAA